MTIQAPRHARVEQSQKDVVDLGQASVGLVD